MKAQEFKNVAEAIIAYVRRSHKTFTNKIDLLEHLQEYLKDNEMPNLAIKDCLDEKADFDLIIKDMSFFVTLKIVLPGTNVNALSDLKKIVRQQARLHTQFDDIDSILVLYYHSKNAIDNAEIEVPFNDEGERMASHGKGVEYSYLWENIFEPEDANDTLYNRDSLARIWDDNNGECKYKNRK